MDIFWNYTLCDLRNEYIKFPSTNREVLATRETFDDLTDLPNVVAAIDGTHDKIKTPKESGPDYFSRLQQHDVVVEAVAKFLSASRQVGRTWRGQLMTGI